MKKLFCLIVLALAGASNGSGQTGFTAVMVNSNGVVQRPTNFAAANNLGADSAVRIVNTLNRVSIQSGQWSRITNTGTILVSDGRMVSSSFTTNSGEYGVAYYGDNVSGHSFLNIGSDSGLLTDEGAGFIVQGTLGGSRVGVIKRLVLRGVSASSLYANTGTNGLNRAGWAVETRLNGTTNQVRLVVHSSSGPTASAWSDIPGSDIKAIWSYRDATNTYVFATSSFGQNFSTVPNVTVNAVAGGTAGSTQFGFAIGMNIISDTSSAPYMDVGAIYESKNLQQQ
jgi:hypothetical protein